MNHEYWYLSRAAGFTAYLLLFVSVALGIAMGTRFAERFARRNTIFDLHRFTTILALAFSVFHVYILLGDGFFSFNVWELSVPFLSPYRSWQTATGVAGLYVMGLVVASFYVRRFIGYRAWRAIHFGTFAMFALVALHGITAGTDTAEPWAIWIYVGTGVATLALILYRVQYHMPESTSVRRLRLGAGAAAVAVTALLILGTGMLDTDNGASAQPESVSSAAVPGAVSDVQHPFLDTFQGQLSGTYSQTRGAATSSLTIDATATGDLVAAVHVELDQASAIPTADNETAERVPDDEVAEARPQPTITANTAELRDTASGAVICSGILTSLANGVLRATCDGGGPYAGVRVSIESELRATNDGAVSGSFTGTMQRLS